MTTVARLRLVGGGGEPVDLWRTLASHGLASLPPNALDESARTLTTTLLLPSGQARTVVVAAADGMAEIAAAGRALSADEAEAAERTIRHMLRLDDDLSGFYAAVTGDPELAWAAAGAGRLLRSPTVFEDVVKTICTTNCAWGGTVRMVTALVDGLGDTDAAGRNAFPTPAAMAEAGDDFYRDVARTGYRGAYLRALARSVAHGMVDLEELGTATPDQLPDDEVAARLLALPGIGPYAAAHVMMLLGRYSRLVLDSWTRPTFAKLSGARKAVGDRTIERRFRRYGRYAGLAFWLYLTRGWVEDGAAARAG